MYIAQVSPYRTVAHVTCTGSARICTSRARDGHGESVPHTSGIYPPHTQHTPAIRGSSQTSLLFLKAHGGRSRRAADGARREAGERVRRQSHACELCTPLSRLALPCTRRFFHALFQNGAQQATAATVEQSAREHVVRRRGKHGLDVRTARVCKPSR